MRRNHGARKLHCPTNYELSDFEVATCDFDSFLNSGSGRRIVLLVPLDSAAYFEDPCGLLLKLKALVRPLASQFCAPPSKLCGRNRCQKLVPQPADDISSEICGVFRQSLCCEHMQATQTLYNPFSFWFSPGYRCELTNP